MNIKSRESHVRPPVGVSAFSVYLPSFRVQLEEWCEWTGASWPKVRSTVGTSFRVAGPHESIYTMAANAVLNLILNNDIDPRSVGYLAMGTESSSDNSAGAILVKGMIDQALQAHGMPRLSRNCEVPEFKHACLGGVYAMKNALRYLICDGTGRTAIVVSADIAEYTRGSSGEQTQGAGAVAQLLEENPKLYSIDLNETASAAAYRGVDFRKPHRRHLHATLAEGAQRFPDYPVFNGKYSTICYTDAAIHAVGRLVQKLGNDVVAVYKSMAGFFMHRPYHRLPENILAALYVWGMAHSDDHRDELRQVCTEAGTDFDSVMTEAHSNPDLFAGSLGGHNINKDVYPHSQNTVKYFRNTPKALDIAQNRMVLGLDSMKTIGNIYTGSLPGWIAAGFEDALAKDVPIVGQKFLTIGYGSGDAAEAMIIRIADDWKGAASRIGFAESVSGAINLTKEQYEALHDGVPTPCPEYEPRGEFIVDHVGATDGDDFQDIGIEYYRYIPR